MMHGHTNLKFLILVDGAMNKNFETFVRFENIEKKTVENFKSYKILYFPNNVKYFIIQNS